MKHVCGFGMADIVIDSRGVYGCIAAVPRTVIGMKATLLAAREEIEVYACRRYMIEWICV